MTTNHPTRVPAVCTLPTAQQPLRLAEFDDLFATSVRHVDVITPTHARLHLAGAEGLTATVTDLTAREAECCSFFRFRVSPQTAEHGEALTLDIEVPAQYADVLAALARSS